MKILIDNGHGSDTQGKCSPDKTYYEYMHARLLASRLLSALKAKGYDAELLVPETTDIKISVRAQRANAICNRLGKANVILISLHSNAAGMGDWMNARGWCIYTSPGVTKADALATCIYNNVEKELKSAGYFDTFTAEDTARKQKPVRSDFSDGDPDYESAFGILTKTLCPAVLSENLFHDNKADLSWLTSEKGINAIVSGHVGGIVEYIKSVS